ncbi:MAG: toxin-antitoxin system YwqK family antitoxin [Flavisolibacter sp.]
MRSTLTTVCLLSMFMAFAQDRKEFFDMSFHPNETSPYYYVLTTKKGMQWEQEAYYISTLKLARRCTFKDESCATPDGSYISYDIDGHLKENGTYKDGKKDGAWFGYNESGLIVDSGMYVSGRLKGVRMECHATL